MDRMEWTLVTGGAKGLGAEICRKLAQQGFNVVLQYRTSAKEAAEVVQTCKSCGVHADCIQGDFATLESAGDFIGRYMKAFPETCALINNVGNYLIKSALDTPIDQWCLQFQTNLHAPFFLIQALMPSLKAHRGSVVNIGAAGLHELRANTYSTAYMIGKTALWMLTKSIALEAAPFNVRVNMVSPGYLENSIDQPKDLKRLLMQRLASCSEVADVVAFLLQENSGYITGQNIEVAGGVRL
jgi:NAD(P)-dependent dehydrogenase (short-subunit alcohol dehydrogenase family)